MGIIVDVQQGNLDAEIQKFRIESEEREYFADKCAEAKVSMSEALRALIKAVNRGRIDLR